MLENTPNQPTKFGAKYWVAINAGSCGTYNTNSQIKFKTAMLRSSDITVTALAASGGNNNLQVVFENCAPFTDCITEINNMQIDNAKDIHVVMPMYNLMEYSNNYSKTSGSLWQYYRDEL